MHRIRLTDQLCIQSSKIRLISRIRHEKYNLSFVMKTLRISSYRTKWMTENSVFCHVGKKVLDFKLERSKEIHLISDNRLNFTFHNTLI